MENLAINLKRTILLIVLTVYFQNLNAQRAISGEVKNELSEKMQLYRNVNILGKWTVKKADGEKYEKVGDSLYKIEYPFNYWKNHQFIFTAETLRIRFRDKPLKTNSYKIDNKGISLIVKRDFGDYTAQIAVDRNKITITYTPEAYYRYLADATYTVEEIKKHIYIPKNVVLHLER